MQRNPCCCQHAVALLFAAVLFAACCANAELMMRETKLEDNWTMWSTAEPATKYTNLTMPHTVIGALVDGGYVDFDPVFDRNLERFNESDYAVPWAFSTTFDVKAEEVNAAKRSFVLHFHGINYRGNVTVNGKRVVSADKFVGSLRRIQVDVTSDVVAGANTLVVELSRPQPSGEGWRNPSTDLSFSYLDWNPHPQDVSMGIIRPVYLRVLASSQASPTSEPLVEFDGFVVDTQLTRQGVVVGNNGAGGMSGLVARLNISVTMKNVGTASLGAAALFDVILSTELFPTVLHLDAYKCFEDQHELLPGQHTRCVFSWLDFEALTIPNPPLWYPWEMSDERPLFTAQIGTADFTTEGTAARIFHRSWRFGIRQVRRVATRYEALQLEINGVPFIVRGGGWTPDIFYRMYDQQRMIAEIAMTRSMGLNTIRLEGMMMTTEFFNYCDEMGMLVLPGIQCCAGWQNWGIWPLENYDIAYESTVSQSYRLAWHPSVMMFLVSSDELPPPRVESVFNNALRDAMWPNPTTGAAEGFYSSLTGPTGVKMTGAYSWVPPSYFLADGSGLLNNGTMNYGGAFGFWTEGGPGESPMVFNSWNRTVPKDHVWEPNNGKSLAPSWNFHMGMQGGHFRNLTRYTSPLDARYGESDSAQQFCYRSQAANMEGIRAMFEGYSIHKHKNATGVIQWMIKMAWPSNLWNLFDDYLVAHGGFFGAKHGAGAKPIHVMMSPVDGSITLYHSRWEERPAITVNVSVWTIDGQEAAPYSKSVRLPSIPGDAVIELPSLRVPIDSMPFPKNSTFFVRISWSHDGEHVERNWYWMSPTMDVITMKQWNDTRITWWQTPCESWADFRQLNSLAPANLEVKFTPFTPLTTMDVFDDAGAEYLRRKMSKQGVAFDATVRNRGTGIAYLIQLRLVRKSTTEDITPAFYDDNFFTLAPGETRTIRVELPLWDAGAEADAIELHVETYNDIVAAETPKVTAVVSQEAPVPYENNVRPNPAPASPSVPSSEESVSKGQYNAILAMLIVCASLLAVGLVFGASQYKTIRQRRRTALLDNPQDMH